MKKIMLALVVTLMCASTAYAQEVGFAQSSSDILNMLTSEGGRAFLKIEFNVNSATISKDALSIVDALGSTLTSEAAASMQVKMVGHTDSAGDREYNRKLSLKRAAAVKKYLVGNFEISPDRIEVDGVGEDSPIAPNNTKMGRAENRRVEVINTGQKSDTKGILQMDEVEKSVPDMGNILFQ